jgi:L-asparaginase
MRSLVRPLALKACPRIVKALVAVSCTAAALLSTCTQAEEPATTCPVAAKVGSGGLSTLPRVIVLATGGTIAGQSDPRAADAYNAGSVGAQQLIKAVPGIDKLARLSTEQVASIGSQDMNDTVWFQLARRIQQISDKNEADAVVITHGTDTLEETAFFLDKVLHTDKPVILVGSMRPSNAISADGPNNLYEAVEVASCDKASGRGVMIVLNDRIEGARWATKTNTTSVQTFRSPDSGSIGYVDPASVGDGNTSIAALAALERAVKKGVVVVRSTRVGSGFVNRNVEVDDDKSGFIVSLDLNPQKARILTQLLIANGVTSAAQMQQQFSATW